MNHAVTPLVLPSDDIETLIYFLRGGYPDIPASVDPNALYQHFFLLSTTSRLVYHHGGASAYIIPTFFLLRRCLDALSAAVSRRLPDILKAFKLILPTVAVSLFEAWTILNAAHSQLRYVIGDQENDLPLLQHRCVPTLAEFNEAAQKLFDDSFIYVPPTAFSPVDTLAIENTNKRLAFIQMALAV